MIDDPQAAALAAAKEAPEADATDETTTPSTDDGPPDADTPAAAEGTDGQADESQPTQTAEDQAEELSRSKVRREQRKLAEQRRREEYDAALRKIADLEQRVAQHEEDQGAPPKMDDFTDVAEWTAALAAHKAGQEIDKRAVKTLQREAEAERQRTKALEEQRRIAAAEGWQAQAADGRRRYADFDAVTQSESVRVTDDMATFIGLSEIGADLAYHLGTHADVSHKIASMPPDKRIGALEGIEMTISTQQPRPRTTTNAPPPVSPVTPKGKAVKEVDDMSADEFAAWRQKGGTIKL